MDFKIEFYDTEGNNTNVFHIENATWRNVDEFIRVGRVTYNVWGKANVYVGDDLICTYALCGKRGFYVNRYRSLRDF